ncbi:EamA/RhaT family transporter [Pusillimonas sp.]|uniref:EamA/RhaT family transporter n=1 Tax=Pusillimonas sp. TaxID=3040095 RepID=UPI0037C895D8
MLNLAASVAASVAVSVLLKIARRHAVEVDQAIAVNYPVAALLCLVLLRPVPAQVLAPDTPWWVLLALGVLLPSIFVAMAGAVRHAGIVVSDAAQRLSLLIPLAAAFLLFGESAGAAKLAGMAVALAALACLLWQPRDRPTTNAPAAGSFTSTAAATLALLLCVWAGYGTIDVLFKQMARSAMNFSSSLFVSFVLAGLIMGLWLLARRTRWHARSMAAGVLLGALNFSNIYFYLRAHQQYPDNPTLVFAAMNIGVIGLGTLVGAWMFKESLPRTKVMGLVLAVIAIGLLLPR